MAKGIIYLFISDFYIFDILFLFKIKEGLLAKRDQLKIGDPTDTKSFTSAVIDDKAFARIKGYIDYAKKSSNLEILGGGKCDDR